MIYESNSVEETEEIALRFSQQLQAGDVIALEGDLGAGKTQFVRGLVRGLGGEPKAVSSPTYVLLNFYEGSRLNVYHLDAYRVGGADDFEAIGFGELLEQGGVVAVEWPSRVEPLLPLKRYVVTIKPVGELTREIDIRVFEVPQTSAWVET